MKNTNQYLLEAAQSIVSGRAIDAPFDVESHADSQSVQFWLLQAWASNSAVEKEEAIYRVLELDPENELAQQGLNWFNGVVAVAESLIEVADEVPCLELVVVADEEVFEVESVVLLDEFTDEDFDFVEAEWIADSDEAEVVETEVEVLRIAEEAAEAEAAEAQRLEDELEAQRVAEEAEVQRLEAEAAEAQRLEEEQAEACRLEQELEAQRVAEEAEAQRLEAEAQRLEEEQAEACRLEDELEAQRVAEEAEAQRLEAEAAEAAEAQQVEEEQAKAEHLEDDSKAAAEASDSEVEDLVEVELDESISHEIAALAEEVQGVTASADVSDEVSNSELEGEGEGEGEAASETSDKPLVLAVDDSPTIRKLVTMTLTRAGFEVITAADGLEALKLLSTSTPDIILSDVNMPRLDGYKLCRFVKKHERTRDIPVVMLSGKDGVFDKLRGKMIGCSDYITKPFESTQLIEKVRLHTGVYAS